MRYYASKNDQRYTLHQGYTYMIWKMSYFSLHVQN
jgi:hypothetical protein